MKKIISAVLAVGLLCTMLVGCGGAAPAASGSGTAAQGNPDQTWTFSLSTIYDANSPAVAGAQKFADEVNSRTNGAVTIHLFTNSALGQEKDQLMAIASGEQDFTLAGVTPLDMYAPEYGYLNAPYLYQSMDHLKNVMNSEIGEGMKDKLRENNIDFIGMAFRATRNTTSNKPIKGFEDLKGIKIRLPEIPSWVDVWGANCLGATPVPIVLSELYTSLQTGVADASEGPYEQFYTYKFNEVQKYLVKTSHVHEWCGIYANKELLDSLPEDIAKIIRDTADEVMSGYTTDLCLEKEEEFHQKLLDEGMEELTPDLTPFIETANKTYEKYFETTWNTATAEQIAAMK